MKRLAAIVLVALLADASAQVTTAPVDAQQDHGAWLSLVRRGAIHSARAITSAENGNALVLDYPIGLGCAIPHLAVLVPLRKEEEAPWSKNVTGVFRIDQRPPIAFDGESSSALGDKFIYIEVKNVASVDELLTQFAVGAAVRFQIGDASSTTVERFSLLGAHSAMQRAMRLCGTL